DRPVVAVPARALRRHGGQEAIGERASDDVDDLAGNPTPLGVERHDALLVATVGRAVVEPSRLDRLVQQTLAGERIQQRLQHRSAADHDVRLGARLPGPGIAGALLPGPPALDQDNRAAQPQITDNWDRIQHAREIVLLALVALLN